MVVSCVVFLSFGRTQIGLNLPAMRTKTSQGDFTEADTLHIRAIEMVKKSLGPKHSSLVPKLIARAEILQCQVMVDRKFRGGYRAVYQPNIYL